MSGILDTLKDLDEARHDEIERWFARQRAIAAPFLTTSVDLRHSGLRLAPVDTNLYPAGFHNLSPAAKARASRFLRQFLKERYPQARRILIIPENHTRNLSYLDNLAALLGIVEGAGLEAKLGSLAAAPGQPIELEAPSGRGLTQYPLLRDARRIRLEDGFSPDLILMNNDMTSGSPALLDEIEQPVVPPVAMGWWRRRKSAHFAAYASLCAAFCAEFDLDAWLLRAEFARCGEIDFKAQTGLDCLARNIERLLVRVRAKYREYGIGDEPFIYVKADSGTYGMGIMTVRSSEEILDLNKKERNKMQIIKEGARNAEVIIQEGIPTIDRIDGKPAEPMVYMIDGVPVGGMHRVNGQRDGMGNLNAAGMEFAGMCDEAEDECGRWKRLRDCHFRAYGIVAAIAALAAAREEYAVAKESSMELHTLTHSI